MSMGHKISGCTNIIRCRACYMLGHKERDCPGKELNVFGKIWVPKKRILTVPDTDTTRSTSPCLEDSSTKGPNPGGQSPMAPRDRSTNLPPSPREQPIPPAPMATFELDPARWFPIGHQIIDGGATRLPRTFYTPTTPPHA